MDLLSIFRSCRPQPRHVTSASTVWGDLQRSERALILLILPADGWFARHPFIIQMRPLLVHKGDHSGAYKLSDPRYARDLTAAIALATASARLKVVTPIGSDALII